MKNVKKWLSFALALLLLVGLTACSGDGNTTGEETTGANLGSNEAEYKVTVVNAKGKPYTEGVIVRFMQNGQQVSMQVVDENGCVAKVMEKGDYSVELMFTDTESEFVYDGDLTLTPEKTELEISLAYALGSESTELFHGETQYTSYYVGVCCTQVPLTAGERSYFLFAPTEPGVYEISAIGDVESIGYYGSPFYIHDSSIEAVENNTFTTTIRAENIGTGGGSTVLVIGIDAGSADSCILSIERIGDPEKRPEDVPYEVYQVTAQLAPYTLPEGAVLQEFDLTASTDTYQLVFNSEDGFYHLDSEDGPLVLVRLGVDNKYMSCYKAIMEKTGIRKYFYDENGNFLRREDYYDCLAQYIGKTDPNGKEMYPGVMDKTAGVYPMTEDLKYIIQNHGGYNGWWDLTSETSIFQDNEGNPIPGINAEIAWLFMCVYME